MSRRLVLPVLVVLLASALAGCGVRSASGTQVVAAFYPLAWAAQQVGGKDASVIDLTTPGVEPHDLELTVRQTAELSTADLVVYEQGFQPSVDSSVQQNARRSLDVATVVRLHQTAQGPDPHFWHDPLRMAAYVADLGRTLARVDPAHSAAYRARSAALVKKLVALDKEYTSGLASCRINTIVVSHDAFNYLGKYGVNVLSIAGLAPDAEPSARHLAQLATLIRTDHITTVFSETLASPKLSQALAGDLGLASEVLDPIEGVTKQAPEGTDYLTLMQSNLQTLRKADSCS